MTSFVEYVTDDSFFRHGIKISNTSLTSFAGFENVTSFVGEFDIQYNPSLSDFCAISNIVTPTASFMSVGNTYNPTVKDILAGNCSE